VSTDYGFKCRECNETREINNARHYMVQHLRAILDNLTAVESVMAIGGMSVKFDGCYGDEGSAMQFAIDHRKLGHFVVVADEYGREWNECGARVDCCECKSTRWCTLTTGHEGEHKVVRK
jgi:hypothetical protein